jgi:hypothetical protein
MVKTQWRSGVAETVHLGTHRAPWCESDKISIFRTLSVTYSPMVAVDGHGLTGRIASGAVLLFQQEAPPHGVSTCDLLRSPMPPQKGCRTTTLPLTGAGRGGPLWPVGRHDDRRENTTVKIPWSGVLTSVQPRIRLTHSFDQLSHTYQGYVLRVQGTIGEDQRGFIVAIGAGAHAKHQLQVGDSVSGLGIAVADPRLETAELYRVSQLRVSPRGTGCNPPPPPWHGLPPDLPTYRARGHRRLASRTYDAQCRSCIWGCRMAVEMIVDHWNRWWAKIIALAEWPGQAV